MRCMRAATKRMKAGASIVNIASVAGEKGCGGAVYGQATTRSGCRATMFSRSIGAASATRGSLRASGG